MRRRERKKKIAGERPKQQADRVDHIKRREQEGDEQRRLPYPTPRAEPDFEGGGDRLREGFATPL